MTLTFNADEVFAIAEMIEENGARMYRRAAEMLHDPEVSELFADLASMEDQHQETFATMRESIKKSNGIIPIATDDKNEYFLKAWADAHIFKASIDPQRELTGFEDVVDVLRMAIDAEKDSIIFYLGMKEAVPDPKDRDLIDRIIWEEMDHFAMLTQDLGRRMGKIN